MGISPVISGLAKKRARLAGEIVYHQFQVEKRRTELEAIDATLRLFDGAPEPHTIRMIRRVSRNTYFGRNELSRMLADLFRLSPDAMAVPEISRALLEQKGIGTDDPQVIDWVCARVSMILRKWRRNGTVRPADNSTWEMMR